MRNFATSFRYNGIPNAPNRLGADDAKLSEKRNLSRYVLGTIRDVRLRKRSAIK